MKILAFGASNSPTSINHKLVTYAAGLLSEYEVELLDLTDYEMPFYRPDREAEGGIPEKAKQFYKKISAADGLLISFAEHNGSYAAAYKNLFDWASRINGAKVYQGKKTVLLSTSPGKGGAQSVLQQAVNSAPHFGMEVKATFSLPTFQENFTNGLNPEYKNQLVEALNKLF